MYQYYSLVNCVFGDVHPDDDKWGGLLKSESPPAAEISYYAWRHPSVKVRGAMDEEDDDKDASVFQSLKSFVDKGYTYLVYHDLDRKDHLFLICLEEEKKAFAWFYAVPFSLPGGPVAGLDGLKALAWRAMPRPLPTSASLLDAFVGPRMEVFVGKEVGGARALRGCVWEKLPPRITNAAATRPMAVFIDKGEAAPVFELPEKEPTEGAFDCATSTTIGPDGYLSVWDDLFDCDEEGQQMDC